MNLKQCAFGTKTDKDTNHSYLETYENHLGRIKSSAKSVLEIGVEEGGSLLMWKRYFETAKITGVDIATKAEQFCKDICVNLIVENAYNVEFVEKLRKHYGSFDLIVDDGPHSLESMMFFLSNFSSLLTDDGILIVEDIQSIDWIPNLMEAIPEKFKSKAKFYDLRNVKGRYDDMIIIIDLK